MTGEEVGCEGGVVIALTGWVVSQRCQCGGVRPGEARGLIPGGKNTISPHLGKREAGRLRGARGS
jgi:hypothetical protein